MRSLLWRLRQILTSRWYEEGWDDGIHVGYALGYRDSSVKIIEALLRDEYLAENLDVYLFERVIDIVEAKDQY